MDSVQFRGNDRDLERFARDVLKRSVAIDNLSPFERRMSWDLAGSSGSSSATTLRSGIALIATRLRWERSSVISMGQAATPIKLMLSRGIGPRMTPSSGRSHVLGQGMFQVSQVKRAMSTTCEFDEMGGDCEHLALALDPARLKELLGTEILPRPVEGILASSAAHAAHRQPMAPALFRLLDEIFYCDARGPTRQLYLEAKGLELLALMIDELEVVGRARSPLYQRDIERLEQARQLVLTRLDAPPPSLPRLARLVGLNEVRLKTGFRRLFGTSVHAYLRGQRMEQAHRLLLQGCLNVTEVAVRVGYSNPSKFAAAFRKHFGIPPSALR